MTSGWRSDSGSVVSRPGTGTLTTGAESGTTLRRSSGASPSSGVPSAVASSSCQVPDAEQEQSDREGAEPRGGGADGSERAGHGTRGLAGPAAPEEGPRRGGDVERAGNAAPPPHRGAVHRETHRRARVGDGAEWMPER